MEYTFERVEKKFVLSDEKYHEFLKLIEPYTIKDKFDKYTICNVYYDTNHYDLIRISLDKPIYKEKLRIRSYGTPKDNDTVFVEIKKKYDKIVYKRRISLTYLEAKKYLYEGIRPIHSDIQILNEIDYFIKHYHILPALYLAYDREAFDGKNENDLRITLDSNLRSRTTDIYLKSGDYGEKYFNNNEHILELKAIGGYPMWLVAILDRLEIYPISFSKYGSIYKKMQQESKSILTINKN